MKSTLPFGLLPLALAAAFPSLRAGERVELLSRGASWKYHYDWAGLPPEARTPEFDDSAWPEGAAQLGYGEGDEATVINPYPPDKPSDYAGDKPVTATFRSRITAPALPVVVMRLTLVRDDGAVVFLNGEEILRTNLPPGEITPATLAERSMSGGEETNPIPFYIPYPPLLSGENLLVVEIHQVATTSNDISFELGVEVWTGPEDDDLDGLPDWWECEVFGNLDHSGGEDADHDGSDNDAEWRAGTDPRDASSVLRPTVRRLANGRALVEWGKVAGIFYRVGTSDALGQWSMVDDGMAGETVPWTWLDPTPAAALPTSRFYRVEASRFPWP